MRESVRVKIEGLNLDKAINKILEADIKIYNLNRKSNREINFDIKYSKKEQLFALFDSLCYNIEILKINSAVHSLKLLRKRIGILVGLAFAFVLICICSFNVTTLKLNGNKDISEEDVKQVLSENGINFGFFNFSCDLEKTKKVLYSNFENIAYLDIKRVGTAVIISIKESENVDQVLNEKGDIISAFDSIITKIVVYKGTPMVKVGDKVNKGDILIKGVVASTDESNLKQEEVRADGIVLGEIVDDVKLNVTDYLDYHVDENAEKIETKELYFFSFNSKMNGTENTLTRYKKVEEKEYLFENFLLPIYVKKTTYIPLSFEADMDKYNEYEMFMENLYLDKHFGGIEYKIKESSKNLTKYENEYFFEYRYKINLDITRFLAKEVWFWKKNYKLKISIF